MRVPTGARSKRKKPFEKWEREVGLVFFLLFWIEEEKGFVLDISILGWGMGFCREMGMEMVLLGRGLFTEAAAFVSGGYVFTWLGFLSREANTSPKENVDCFPRMR